MRITFVCVVASCAALIGGCDQSTSSPDKQVICNQSADAAHYIASLSTSSDETAAVTRQAIADRKYPALDDKELGLIGTIVMLSRANSTPDEISAKVRDTCLRGSAQQ